MTTKYYKTNNASVLAAHHDFHQQVNGLREQANIWAAQFDAEPVYSVTTSHTMLVGLRLNNRTKRDDAVFWTNPIRGGSDCSWPRARMKKDHKLHKDELVALTEKYNSTMPVNRSISREHLLSAVGTDWGNVMFGGLKYFKHDGFLYFATGAVLQGCAEILGSEFEAAERLKTKEQ